MQRRLLSSLSAAALAVSLVFVSPVAHAADLGAGVTVDRPAADLSFDVALSRYHDLLAIRVTFDVIAADDLAPQLAAAASRWAPAGPGAGEAALLDNALLAEASYYLTTIAYVVEVGGAAFPADRPYDSYRNDTLVAVYALRDRLFAAVAAGEAVHDILVEAQRLHWLTEGETSVPEGKDHFAGHDELIKRLTTPDTGLAT